MLPEVTETRINQNLKPALNLGGSFDPVSDAGVHWTRIYENVTPPTSYNGNAGHIYGLTLSNDVGTPATIIDIAAGSARDSTNAIDMTITTAWTKKINAVWAAGTGNGGFTVRIDRRRSRK